MVKMTICDYHMTMKRVGIAELKARLSEHLRRVREGESVTVLDRRTPVARLVPWEREQSPLRIRGPKQGAPRPGEVELPEPTQLGRDVVELLLEDRGSGR